MKLLAWVFVLGVLTWSGIGLAGGVGSPPLPVAVEAAPPKTVPYWKRCVTGRRCVRAVLPHIFRERWRAAFRVASCETGGTFYNHALGSSGERGIFQIHPVHFHRLDESRLWDVRYNSRFAYRLSRGGTNWSHWTCRP